PRAGARTPPRVKTENTRPPRTTSSAASPPRATASRRARSGMDGTYWVEVDWPRGSPDSAQPRRGAGAEGRAAGRDADPGRHRRDGRAQLRPRAAAGAVEPERGARAARPRAGEGTPAARLGADLHGRDAARRAAARAG